MKARALCVALGIAAASAIFAACGGSSSGPPSFGGAAPQLAVQPHGPPCASPGPSLGNFACPTPTPSGPDKGSATVNLSTQHGPQQMPPVSHYTEVLVIPSASPAAGKLNVVVSVTKPSGLPTPSAIRVHPNAAAPSTPIGYIQETLFDTPQVTFAQIPSFSFTVQQGVSFPPGPYQVEEFDAANPQLGWQVVGPAMLSGSTLTFNGPPQAFTLTHEVTVTFALVGAPAPPPPGTAIASLSIHLAYPTLPLGQNMYLTVIAKDSHGIVITGSYDHPIVLGSSTLTFSTSSLGDSTQATNVVTSWVNGYAGSSAGLISATADGHSVTAVVAPQTGFAFYTVGTNPNTDNNGYRMQLGPDGNLYYGTLCVNGFCTSNDGAVGQFNPATKVAQEIELRSEDLGLLFSSDGALWIAGGSSDNLFRLPPHNFTAAALQTIPVPAPSPNPNGYIVRGLTQAGANVWFVDVMGSRVLKIPVAGPYVSGSITAHALPAGPAGTPGFTARGNDVAYGSDGNIYVLDFLNGVVDRVSPATGRTTAQTLTPQQVQIGTSDSSDPRFFAKDASGRLYFTQLGTLSGALIGDIDSFVPGSGGISVSALPGILAGTEPYTIDARGSDIYYADYGAGGLGFIGESNGTARLYPITPQSNVTGVFKAPGGVAVLADGTAWFTCYGENPGVPFQPLCLGHTVYLNGWSIFPSRAIDLLGSGNAFAQIVGIMEGPSANSGPFRAVSNNTGVCTTSSVVDHNFNIVGVAAGRCSVTVTDAHAVSEVIQVTVYVSGAVRPTIATKRHAPMKL